MRLALAVTGLFGIGSSFFLSTLLSTQSCLTNNQVKTTTYKSVAILTSVPLSVTTTLGAPSPVAAPSCSLEWQSTPGGVKLHCMNNGCVPACGVDRDLDSGDWRCSPCEVPGCGGQLTADMIPYCLMTYACDDGDECDTNPPGPIGGPFNPVCSCQ